MISDQVLGPPRIASVSDALSASRARSDKLSLEATQTEAFLLSLSSWLAATNLKEEETIADPASRATRDCMLGRATPRPRRVKKLGHRQTDKQVSFSARLQLCDFVSPTRMTPTPKSSRECERVHPTRAQTRQGKSHLAPGSRKNTDSLRTTYRESGRLSKMLICRDDSEPDC